MGTEMKKINSSNILKKINIIIGVYLILITLLVRSAFFFKDIINWDESTFILMGQSIIDGNLPYTELWDLKPPGVFFIFALFITLFGKSIVSIRLGGALCVILTSFCTYYIGKNLSNNRVGILAATLCTFMVSALPAGQATMTEHLAIVPLVGALTILVIKKKTLFMLFLTGILMGIATMIRLNLAYVTFIIGFCLLFVENPLLFPYNSIKRGFVYSIGVFFVIGLFYLPYLITGYQQIWWDSVVIAPLSYADSQHSMINAFRLHLRYIWSNISDIRKITFGISILLWIGGLAGIIFNFKQWKNNSKEKKEKLLWIILFLISTLISILKGGATHSHYLIQLVPFMSLMAAVFLDSIIVGQWIITSIIVMALVISMKPSIGQYKYAISRILGGESLIYGATYEIADYLTQENAINEPVYMMTDHLVYWHINAKPMRQSVTHPSNIGKEYLLKVLLDQDTSTEIELNNILTQKPKFIIKNKSVWYLSRKNDANLLLETTLNNNYQLVKEIQGRQIYRRI
jgi:4-amino-4-deoxy-L-arabinose transferase-like glycosyltransferase